MSPADGGPSAGSGAGTSAGSGSTSADGAGSPRIGLIWAQARGGVIGADGTMPWHLPEDLKHFSRTTTGSPVVMGRRTWQSFPARFRPLPGRTNIVITRDEGFAANGALRARNLPEGLGLARGVVAAGSDGSTGDGAAQPGAARPGATQAGASPIIWVIGGGAVYREAIEQAELLVVTEIDLEVAGDTTAPGIPEAFTLATADPETGWHTSAGDVRYRILTYTR